MGFILDELILERRLRYYKANHRWLEYLATKRKLNKLRREFYGKNWKKIK
jgi:hypothetical protein